MDNDVKYWLAFAQFNKIGPHRFKKLYNFFPSMEIAWKATTLELEKAGLEKKLIGELMLIKNNINPDHEIEKIKKENIQIITIKDDDYPKLLKEIFNPPALLFIKGNLKNLNNKFNLAVVGTRKISNYGQQITPKIITPLVKNGLTITSGMALGVDTLAHQITIDNKGLTIAVLGCGIDEQSIYPKTNRYLAQKIIANNGTLLSEFACGTQPLKHNFPQRNRIIAGLCLGTLVIEAAASSGALITAYSALEQNREVFAIPGSLFNNNSLGTNKLIQKGAKLVTDYKDILEELNLEEVQSYLSNKQILPDNNEEKIILDQINQQPTHIDEIIKKAKLKTNQVTATLSLMEMKGMIKNLGGKNYIRL